MPTAFAEEMFAGHFQRLVPFGWYDVQADFTLKFPTFYWFQVFLSKWFTMTSCLSEPVSVDMLESMEVACVKTAGACTPANSQHSTGFLIHFSSNSSLDHSVE